MERSGGVASTWESREAERRHSRTLKRSDRRTQGDKYEENFLFAEYCASDLWANGFRPRSTHPGQRFFAHFNDRGSRQADAHLQIAALERAGIYEREAERTASRAAQLDSVEED